MIDRPIIFSGSMVLALLDGTKGQTRRPATRVALRPNGLRHVVPTEWRSARPGMRLWVKENFYQWEDSGPVFYAASTPEAVSAWTSSRYMPRRHSRITLTITDVRVQRLQDIVLDDVLAEGCPVDPDFHDTTQDGSGSPMVKIGIAQWRSPRAWYHVLWDQLHGAGAWDANPEVVALTFAVRPTNIDQEAT